MDSNIPGTSHLQSPGTSSSPTGQLTKAALSEPDDQYQDVVDTFRSMESGETLTLINDRNPESLFFEMYANCEQFDSDGYELRVEGEDRYVTKFPKG